MPSKTYDTSRPSFYLDTSTLCDAFRVHRSAERQPELAYLPLKGWIERIAGESNLCLSFTHLWELAKWGDLAAANEIGAWLDALPTVWIRSSITLKDDEEDVWTRRAADVTSPDVEPFAPSLLSAFDATPSPDAVADVLASPTPVLHVLNEARQLKDRHATAPFDAAQAFRDDRQAVAALGLSETQLSDRVAQNMRTELRECVERANARLTRAGDQAYAAKGCTVGEVQERLVHLYESDPKAMPLFRLGMLSNAGFIAGVLRRTPGSAKDHDLLTGSFHDAFHLVGAAYCDVFTCDSVTSDSLGGFRASIGKNVQLAARGHAGGIAAFVQDLMATST